MSNVGIKNYFGGWGVAPGSVESEEAVASHCNGEEGGNKGGGEDGKEKAGQASPEAIRYTRIYIKTKFKSQNVTNIPAPDCMTTRIQHLSKVAL